MTIRRRYGALAAIRRSGWVAVFVVSSGGCGSESPSDGKSDACQSGETRTCVGPGACQGGQQCSASGVWSSCDCGGVGGSSATGGDGGNSGTGSGASGGTGTGASGGTQTGGSAGYDGGSAGAPGDAGADVTTGDPPGPNDDPCPTEGIDLNCSTQCGAGPDPACATDGCTMANPPIVITSESQLPYVLRMPANPAV